jgi:hypothetical protein
MNRLYEIFKTPSGPSTVKALLNHTIFSPSQTGETVPLSNEACWFFWRGLPRVSAHGWPVLGLISTARLKTCCIQSSPSSYFLTIPPPLLFLEDRREICTVLTCWYTKTWPLLCSHVGVLVKREPYTVLTCWYAKSCPVLTCWCTCDPCPVLTYWCTCQTWALHCTHWLVH